MFKKTTLLIVSVLAILGCGDDSDKRVPVKGRVVHKAQPIGNKTLNLVYIAEQPVDSFTHSLPLDPQGQFSGEVPKMGKYKVTIAESFAVMDGFEKPSAKGPKIPEKYKVSNASDITIEIGKSGYTGDIELND